MHMPQKCTHNEHETYSTDIQVLVSTPRIARFYTHISYISLSIYIYINSYITHTYIYIYLLYICLLQSIWSTMTQVFLYSYVFISLHWSLTYLFWSTIKWNWFQENGFQMFQDVSRNLCLTCWVPGPPYFSTTSPGDSAAVPRQIFREADADESGDLDREELRIALRAVVKVTALLDTQPIH